MTYRVEGRLALAFEVSSHDGTKLNVLAQQPPLKVIRAFALADGASLVHVHNVSGGILGGDKLELTVQVGAQARAQLTTTSATRLYRRSAHKTVSRQTNDFTIGSGALLEVLPDPLIPFAHSAYEQFTRIDLADDAGLFLWETVAPGRAARGELFAYDSLTLKLDIFACQQPIALEHIRLEPQLAPLTSPVRLGPYRHFSTFYICRVGLPDTRWTALEAELMALAQQMSSEGTLWSVSRLVAHGLVVRVLSLNSREIAQGLVRFWQTAKQALYGTLPIPPRKIY
ncbi:MAG: urease accessory protein UreD [Aggregatilineales bacterium]